MAQQLRDITANDLRKVVQKWNKRKRGGLDGWRVDELQYLPEAAYEQLARVLNLIETTGDWPEAAVTGSGGYATSSSLA